MAKTFILGTSGLQLQKLLRYKNICITCSLATLKQFNNDQNTLQVVQSSVLPDMFKSTYEAITKGNPMWNQLSVSAEKLYSWDTTSTYIHEPPYFKGMTMNPPGPHGVKDAYCLLNFGDSITTDHISPAGSINKDSPAAKYLMERGVERKDFNSYGSRRGNDEIMARGTFANIRIVNKLLKGEVGPKTVHIPSGEKLYVFDAAMVISLYSFIDLLWA